MQLRLSSFVKNYQEREIKNQWFGGRLSVSVRPGPTALPKSAADHIVEYNSITPCDNLYSPHMVVQCNKNSNGTISNRKKYNGNALSIGIL